MFILTCDREYVENKTTILFCFIYLSLLRRRLWIVLNWAMASLLYCWMNLNYDTIQTPIDNVTHITGRCCAQKSRASSVSGLRGIKSQKIRSIVLQIHKPSHTHVLLKIQHSIKRPSSISKWRTKTNTKTIHEIQGVNFYKIYIVQYMRSNIPPAVNYVL